MASISGNLKVAQQPRKEKQKGAPLLCEVQDVLTTLSSKRVKLCEWIQKAWTFYNQNQFDGFVVLLENAIARGMKSYPGYKEDLLRIHTMLAAHFVRLACSEHGHRRAMWQERVAQQLHTMDSMQLVSNETQHLLCRGFALMLTETRLQDADNCFVAVLRQMAYNVPALLGRACLAYNRGEYRVALGYFKSVLQQHSQGPCDVRVGIAHCFLQLGDLDSARRAFEMAVARNGRCINALLGMAQLKLNERQRAATMEATNLLCAAYELNYRHPVVLSWLACYLYYSRNYDKLQMAAGNAFLNTDNALLKAQNCFQIARSFHATRNYDRAFDFYGKALECHAEYAPPHLGIAQMYVRRGQLDLAEHSLRSLLKLLPEQAQGLRMLATLYAQSGSPCKLDMAIELFKSALERAARDDYDIWLGLAGAYERKQLWLSAIDGYDQAISIYLRLHSPAEHIPIPWLNNKATLQMHAGRPKAALQTLDQALATNAAKAAEDQECGESNMLTLRFNRARVLEELHLAAQAETEYKKLIAEYPNYYDSYLRLGVIASRRNQKATALECYKAVLQLDPENVAARIFMGNFYVRQGKLSQAMTNYNVIMRRPGSFGDAYMLIAVGNVCLIKNQRSTASGQQAMARQYVEHALQLFRKALEQNPRNVWAANGIAIALSKHGLLSDGESIFKLIVESSKRCSAALLNLAHVALAQEHYSEAITRYKESLEQLPPGNSVREMQLLARAFYQVGRYKEAKHLLLQGRLVAPQDMSLLYNLAITMQQDIIEKLDTKSCDFTKLEQELQIAQSFFECVDQKEESLRPAINEANKCSMLLEKLKCLRELEELQKSEDRQNESQQDYSKTHKSREVKLSSKKKSTKKEHTRKRHENEISLEIRQKDEKENPVDRKSSRNKRHRKHEKEKSKRPAKILEQQLIETQTDVVKDETKRVPKEFGKKEEKHRSRKRKNKSKERRKHGKKLKKQRTARKHRQSSGSDE